MFGKSIPALAAPLALGLGLAGAAIGAGQAGSAPGPVQCEIRTSGANGVVALEGVVRSDVAVSGSYSFRVRSTGPSGGSNIQQGGAFTAGPDNAVTVGRMTLGGNAVYEATLEISAGAASVQCAERISGAI